MRRLIRGIARYELVVLGVATPFLLFPGLWTPMGVALIALAWACRWATRGRITKRTPMDIPIILLVVMLGVSLIPSVDLRLSLNRLWIYILGIALFYGMVNGLHDDGQIQNMGILLVLVGMGVALVSLVSTDFRSAQLIELPSIYGRLPPPLIRGLPGSGVIEEYDLVNPRAVAGALVILLPVPLAYVLFGGGWKLKLLSGLTAFVMAGVLLLTQSPQGLLGLAAGMLVIGVWRSRWVAAGVVVTVVGAGLAWVVLGSPGPAAWLPASVAEYLPRALMGRIQIWGKALYMIRDTPYTGIGLNTFPRIVGLYSVGPSGTPDAHNTVLQTAVDLGVPGLAILLALLATFGYASWGAYRASINGNQRALLIGICAGVTASLAYGLLESISLGHKPAAARWVMLGAVGAMQAEGHVAVVKRTVGKRKWALAAALVPVLVLGCVGAPRSVSAFYLNLGVLQAHKALSSAASEAGAHHRWLERGEVYLEQATRWDANSARAHYWTGRVLAAVGQYDEALSHLDQAIGLDEGDAVAHYHLGQAYYQLGHDDAAIKHWKQAEATAVVLGQARDASRKEHHEESERLYAAAVAIDAEEKRAWLGLGQTYATEEKWEQALNTYVECTSTLPAEPECYIYGAELLYRQHGEAAAAIALLEEGLSACQEKGPLYLRLSLMYSRAGQLSEGEALAKRAVELMPENGDALMSLGDLYVRQDRYEDAIVAYESAAETGNWRWQWSAHVKLGSVYAATGDLAIAVEECGLAVSLAEEHGLEAAALGRTYAASGDALLEAGQTSEAAEAYQQALRVDRGNEHAREQLAELGLTN